MCMRIHKRDMLSRKHKIPMMKLFRDNIHVHTVLNLVLFYFVCDHILELMRGRREWGRYAGVKDEMRKQRKWHSNPEKRADNNTVMSYPCDISIFPSCCRLLDDIAFCLVSILVYLLFSLFHSLSVRFFLCLYVFHPRSHRIPSLPSLF